MLDKILRETDKKLDEYKGRYIVDSGGIIEIVEKDGSKSSGRRTSMGMSYEEQLREAYKYIDWSTEGKSCHPISTYIDLSGTDDVFLGMNKMWSYIIYVAERKNPTNYIQYHYKMTIWEPRGNGKEGRLIKNEFFKTKEEALSALNHQKKIYEDSNTPYTEVCEDAIKYEKGGLVVPAKKYLEEFGYKFKEAPEEKQRIGEFWYAWLSLPNKGEYLTDVGIQKLAKEHGFSSKSGADEKSMLYYLIKKDDGEGGIQEYAMELPAHASAPFDSKEITKAEYEKYINDIGNHLKFAEGGHLNSVGSDLSDQMWGADPTIDEISAVVADTYEPTIYTATQFDEHMAKGGSIGKYKIDDKVVVWSGNTGNFGKVVDVIKHPTKGITYKVELENGNFVYETTKNIKPEDPRYSTRKIKPEGLIAELDKEIEAVESSISVLNELLEDAKSEKDTAAEKDIKSQVLALELYLDKLQRQKHFIEKKSMLSPDKYDLRYNFSSGYSDLATMFRNFFVNMGGKVEKDKFMNFIDGLNPNSKKMYLKSWEEYKKLSGTYEKDGLFINPIIAE